jgi:FkbM family methyltransferase
MSDLVEVCGHTFLSTPFGKHPRVLDVGANRGSFARAIASRFGADVRIVEANPRLYSELSKSTAFPSFHCAVVAYDADSVRFNLAVNDEGSSVLTLPEKSCFGSTLSETVQVPGRSLTSLLQEIGWDQIDLLKLDIEGAEVEVLDSLDRVALSRIAQLTVEFHSAPQFCFDLGPQVEQCLERLAKVGFVVVDFTFPSRVDVLLVNTKLVRLSLTDRLKWKIMYNPPRIFDRSMRMLLPERARMALGRLRKRLTSHRARAGNGQ